MRGEETKGVSANRFWGFDERYIGFELSKFVIWLESFETGVGRNPNGFEAVLREHLDFNTIIFGA